MAVDYANLSLTSFQGLVGMGAAYLVLKFGGQAAMQNREAMSVRFAAMVSNALLAVGSLWMFAGTAYHLVVNWSAAGWDPNLLVCDPELKLHQGMDLYLYAFYVSKYWEYIDTVFLILGKKDVIFLHWFHHLITPSIAWAAWFYAGPSTWIGPLTNTGVHVVMYTYYAMTYFGLSRWVGRYITRIQIVQFVTVLGVMTAIFANYIFFQGPGPCAGPPGSVPSLTWSYANYLNFLALFVAFNSRRTKKLAEAARLKAE